MPDPSPPLCFSQVLQEEFFALHREELEELAGPKGNPEGELHRLIGAEIEALPLPNSAVDTEIRPDEAEARADAMRRAAMYRLIHQRKHAALCISGGGIRSATFGLGVMQGLARRGLLDKFHYLSTVSGGGYIGSWLTAWMARHERGAAGVVDELASRSAAPPGSADHILQPEPPPLRHLRQYSNYLSPRLGILSADTWTLAATYLRNLILNWFVFLPVLAAILMPPRVCIAAVRWSPPPNLRFGLLWLTFIAGSASAIYAIAYVGLHRPSTTGSRADQKSFLWRCLFPLSLSAVLLTSYWAWLRVPDSTAINRIRWESFAAARANQGDASRDAASTDDVAARREQFRQKIEAPRPTDTDNQLGTIFGISVGGSWVPFTVFGVSLHLLGWCAYGFRRRPPDAKASRPSYRILEFLLNMLTGALGGCLAWLAATKVFPNPSLKAELFVCFAAPLYLVLFLLSLTVFAGISSSWTADEDREWWARMGGWVLIGCLGWAVLSTVDIFGPAVLTKLPEYLAPLGGLSGLVTLLLGAGPSSNATAAKKANAGASGAVKEMAPRLAAPVFALFVVVGLSALTSLLLLWLSERMGLSIIRGSGSQFSRLPDGIFHHLKVVIHTPFWLLVIFTVGLLAAAFALAACINSNKFSLHAMYRNRLIRAYLGASRSNRKPNLFTGFDRDDNLYSTQVWPNPAVLDQPRNKCRVGLLHVINMALNLVSGEELGWQERKAESFTSTALHTGSYALGYRKSQEYGGPRGISLGTAVTISGAAANPDMGYHSSPVVSFLLSLFNARLGAWLGNPGERGNKTYTYSYPPWPMRTVIEEAFGLTNNRGAYVSLSDGGHFDNLGLYEMVLRRCHFIVVSDAGCDPDFNFEDLGGAVRKIRIDFGIPIEFEKQTRLYPRSETNYIGPPRYCAVARIRYSAADGTSRADDGWLVYIKPAIYNTEPRDVYQYARQNPEFPHQSTADQFFNESQFESYRALGAYQIEQILSYWEGTGFERLAHHIETVYLA